MTDLLEDALLLTAALIRNADPAGGLDLDVTADGFGITVTVTDHPDATRPDAAHPASTTAPAQNPGLALIDRLAAEWGSTHHAKGRSVWCTLQREGTAHLHTLGAPATGLAAVRSLLQISPATDGESTPARFAEELLRRTADLLRAPGVAAHVDRGDGRGPQPLAECGHLDADDPQTRRIPLPVSRPWSGELLLAAPESPYSQVLSLLAAERLGLVLEIERLSDTDLRRQDWLTFLAEVSELLAQSLDAGLTMALIPRLVVPRLGRWCAVYVTGEAGEPALAAAAHTDETRTPHLLSALADGNSPGRPGELREALRAVTYTPLAAPLDGFAVPLIARGQWLGALAVGRDPGRGRDPDEITIAEEVARRVAVAIDNARIHDERRQVAHTLQQALLPAHLPEIEGLGIGAQYVPAGEGTEVGGDFYDLMPLPGDRWLLLVGDVCGKGVHAATATGLVRTTIRALTHEERTMESVLGTLNQTLLDQNARYCTLAAATVRTRPGEPGGHPLEVSLSLAGHDGPMLIRDGRVTQLGRGGTALGLLDTIESPVESCTLDPGDTLVFFTDGVTERRRGGDLFGLDRLKHTLRQLAGHSADVIAARLRTAVLDFSADPPRDDIAILVVRNETRP